MCRSLLISFGVLLAGNIAEDSLTYLLLCAGGSRYVTEGLSGNDAKKGSQKIINTSQKVILLSRV